MSVTVRDLDRLPGPAKIIVRQLSQRLIEALGEYGIRIDGGDDADLCDAVARMIISAGDRAFRGHWIAEDPATDRDAEVREASKMMEWWRAERNDPNVYLGGRFHAPGITSSDDE